MSRKRRCWLVGQRSRKPGKRMGRGKYLPGYYVNWHEYDANGRRILHSHCFDSLQHAKEYVKRQNAKSDLKMLDEVIPELVSRVSDEFIVGLSARRPETARQYSNSITQLVEHLGNVEVCSIGRAEIDRFISNRMASASEATAAKDCRHLSRFFNWCVENNYHTMNPIKVATSKPSNTIVRKKPRITDEQFARLIDALDTEDRKIAVWIAATTGLDRGVIEGLTVDDVDLCNQTFDTTRIKTNRQVCPVIVDSLVAPLRSCVAGAQPGQPLFRGLSHQGDKSDWWKRAATTAGMPNLRFVDLRTYAVNWLRRIVGDFDAAKMVGHSRAQTTYHHYHQLDLDKQRQLAAQPLPGNRVNDEKLKTRKA
ncbi:MAG: hypothetical protein HJJLKODD_02528 [Phycisphaerae bacterium]|nr:hypothetical protein [Phycisphaerae bacterium]